MADEPGRPSGPLERLARRRAPDDELAPPLLTGGSASGLLQRLSGRDSAVATLAAPEPVVDRSLLTWLGRRVRAERSQADLLMVLAAGPRGFQWSSFLRVISNGELARSRPNQLETPGLAGPTYLLLNLPRADIADLPGRLGAEHFVELLSPKLCRYYRFTDLAAMAYCAGDARVPLLSVMSFPFLERNLRRGKDVEGRLWQVLRERDRFGERLGHVIADIVVPRGGAVFEVRYFIQHQAATSPSTDGLFGEDEIDCVWSGDRRRIADHFNDAIEIGAIAVPMSC